MVECENSIRQCILCGADIVVLRRKGPRDKCKRCLQKEAMRRFIERHPGRRAELNRESAMRCVEHKREYNRQYQQTHLEQIAAKTRRWAEKNRDEINERARRHYVANRDKCIQYVIDRYNRMRAPKWANKDEIGLIYALCRFISQATGIEHHVDHIIPLRGKLVCGLHVENNLRIITAEENCSKHNRFDPALLE